MSDHEEELRRVLEKLEESNNHARRMIDTAEYRAELLSLQRRLLEEQAPFLPGDLVTWKEGMKNKKFPPEGGVGVVVDHRPEPVVADQGDGTGSPYWLEPLDLQVGLLDADDRFVVFWYDSRRFQSASEATLPSP